MVIPGTYIEVRPEGLITPGRVSTGIVGVVGTAADGPVDQPVTLSGFAEARELYGRADPFERPSDGANPLTLVRALEQIYSNGATSVIGVRVAGGSRSAASFALRDGDGDPVVHLAARHPGTNGNELRVQVLPAEEECRIDGELHTSGFDSLEHARVVPSPENRLRIFRGETRRVDNPDVVYRRIVEGEEVSANAEGRYFLARQPVEQVATINAVEVLGADGSTVHSYGDGTLVYGAGAAPPDDELRVNDTTGELIFAAAQVPVAGETVIATYAAGHAAPESGQVLITAWDATLEFAAGEAPDGAAGDTLEAAYLVDRRDCFDVELSREASAESFRAPDGRVLARLVDVSSRLATATADETHGGGVPRVGIDAFFGSGSNTPGSDGAEAAGPDHARGLETLANRIVNIVVLAGQDSTGMGSELVAHLKSTEATDHERIGVLGAPGRGVADFLGHTMADGRVIVVAPGIAYLDGRRLPAAYTAAAVAGLIASIDVETSLTNKVLNVPGLDLDANRGQQTQLIRRNVLAVIERQGFRVVKGITTAGEGAPFSAVPTRRIVDFAKYGVRSAANPYIGRLNNSRVRAALKSTLDAFLTRMVQDEALTGYELEVSATRAQEIAGEVNVAMTIQPTFSINFIRVTMVLK